MKKVIRANRKVGKKSPPAQSGKTTKTKSGKTTEETVRVTLISRDGNKWEADIPKHMNDAIRARIASEKTQRPESEKPPTFKQLKSWLRTLESTRKMIVATHINDPETNIVEAHCLAAIARLRRRISRALAGGKK